MNSFRVALALLSLITFSFIKAAQADILFDTVTMSYLTGYDRYLAQPELYGKSVYDYQTGDKFLYMASFNRPDASAIETIEMQPIVDLESLFPYQAALDEANAAWTVGSGS